MIQNYQIRMVEFCMHFVLVHAFWCIWCIHLFWCEWLHKIQGSWSSQLVHYSMSSTSIGHSNSGKYYGDSHKFVTASIIIFHSIKHSSSNMVYNLNNKKKNIAQLSVTDLKEDNSKRSVRDKCSKKIPMVLKLNWQCICIHIWYLCK